MDCYWLIQAVVGLFISYRVVRVRAIELLEPLTALCSQI